MPELDAERLAELVAAIDDSDEESDEDELHELCCFLWPTLPAQNG